MSIILKVFRGLVVMILASLLVTTLVLTVINYTVKTTLLDAQFVKDRLSNSEVYDHAEDTVIEMVGDAFSEQADESVEGGWQAELFEDTIDETLQDADISTWLQEQVENILENEQVEPKEGVYPYFKSESDDLEIIIDMRSFKNSLKTSLEDNIQEAFQELQDSGELPQLVADNLPEGYELPEGFEIPEEYQNGYPLPDGTDLPDGTPLPEGVEIVDGVVTVELPEELIEEAVDAAFTELDSQLEDEIDISPSAADLQDIESTRDTITALDTSLPYFYLLIGILMLAIIVLLLIPFRDILGKLGAILRTIGFAFLAAGIVCLILGYVGASLLPDQIPVEEVTDSLRDSTDTLTENEEDADEGGMADLIADVLTQETIEDFFSHLLAPVTRWGTILSISGAIMIIGWIGIFIVNTAAKSKAKTKDEEDDLGPKKHPKDMPGTFTDETSNIFSNNLDQTPPPKPSIDDDEALGYDTYEIPPEEILPEDNTMGGKASSKEFASDQEISQSLLGDSANDQTPNTPTSDQPVKKPKSRSRSKPKTEIDK
ncbi:MAG: hypothetical protein SVY53_10120 [Chloroflexota bacterium]|nr:hypothetical protein [Chloroflexota bacterium]